MKNIVVILLMVGLWGLLCASNWSVSGLVTLDTVSPVLTVTSPQEDDRYLAGDNVLLTWNSLESNIPANCINIFWRTNASSAWQSIQSSYNNTGTYNWSAPVDSTWTAMLKIAMTDSFGNPGSVFSQAFAILPPMADFCANMLSGFVPLELQFTDLSPGSPIAWIWDLNGDGTQDSNEQNPNWTYDFPGPYTISLTVDYNTGSCLTIKPNYISATLNPAISRHVPSQYSTIQAAINAAVNGDYVIVEDGTYYENLQIVGKEITLASHYFIDGDTMHIDDTVIDGSQSRNPAEGSVIAIRPGTSPGLSSHIIGFTITHGRGRTVIQTQGSSTITKSVGGGIYVDNNHPILTRNKIVENDADDEGGGSYAFQGLPNLGGMVGIGRINHGGNLFRDNQADLGKDIYIDGVGYRDEIKAQNCGFSVFAAADTTVSTYWATSTAPIDFTGGQGERQAITSDIWVATDGSNANSGTSSNSPFLSIDYALSLAYGSEEEPVTIHIAPGIYSPSFTGERFPLQMISWVTLAGSGADETFLDAEATVDMPNRVINMDKVQGCTVRDLTLTGGVVSTGKGLNGGGIAIVDADVNLSSITALNCSAAGDGGCLHIMASNADCDDLNISSSSATGYGGALAAKTSQTSLNNSQLSSNSANRGAGIYAIEGKLTMTVTQVLDNSTNGTQRRGGGIYLVSNTQSSIHNSIIKGNSADTGAGIFLQDALDFSILNSKLVNNLQSVSSFSNGGGALYWNAGSSGLLANNLIANNTAYQGGAGYGMSTLDFRNNTISNNRANYRGGAFYLNACSPSFLNTILWGNTAASGGPQLWLQTNSSDPEITYSDIQGGTAAFGLSTGSYTGSYQNNLNANPLFVSPTAGVGYSYDALEADFSLPETSPCVNTGNPTTVYSSFPFDLGGFARLSGPIIDMGSYEFQFPLGVLDPPQNVEIDISGNLLTLSWDAVDGAAGYRIYASDDPYGINFVEIPISSGTMSQQGARLVWNTSQPQHFRRFYMITASSDRCSLIDENCD